MRVGPATNVARINVAESITALWTFAHANGISLDDIIERTAAAGVTIDGVLLKDSSITIDEVGAAGNNMLSGRVTGDAAKRFELHGDGGMEWGTGAAARDTDLFRALADVLATSDSFRVAGVLGLIADIITERTAAAGVTIDGVLLKDKILQLIDIAAGGNDVIRTGVVADAFSRLRINANGDHFWGDGVAAGDVNLFRNAADELKTDDGFIVGGPLDALDVFQLSASSPAQITASQNDYVIAATTMQRLDLDAAWSITGIAGGAAGRLVIIVNISGFVLTLTSEDVNSAAANRMSLPNAADIAVGVNEVVALIYDGISSRWRAFGVAI